MDVAQAQEGHQVNRKEIPSSDAFIKRRFNCEISVFVWVEDAGMHEDTLCLKNPVCYRASKSGIFYCMCLAQQNPIYDLCCDS